MRRRNSVPIRVKAPSRGLVTRVPSDIADTLRRGDRHKAMVVAENVRFQDGQMQMAPGYERVELLLPILQNMVEHWSLDEVSGPRTGVRGAVLDVDAGKQVVGSSGKFGNAASFVQTFENAGTLGVLEYVSGSDPTAAIANGDDFTVSFWLRSPIGSTNGYQIPVLGAARLLVQLQDDDLQVWFWDGTAFLEVNILSSISGGAWHFVSVTHTASTKTVGVRVDAATASDTYSATLSAYGAGSFAIGNSGSGSVGFLVDSCTVWSRVLSSGELDTIYDSGDGVTYPFLESSGSVFSLMHEAEVIQDPPNPLYLGTDTNLYLGTRSYDGDTRTYSIALTEIFTGTAKDTDRRWTACDFFDKTVFSHRNIVPQYQLTTTTDDLPGLPVAERFDGVASFQNHLIGWKDEKIKWCADSDFTTWIPVAQTAASARLDFQDFTQPSAGGTVVVDVDDDPVAAGLVVGQYVRVDDVANTRYNFYTVDAVTGEETASYTTAMSDEYASYETSLTGSNNDLVFTAKQAGSSGNNIAVIFVDPGTDKATEEVAVVGSVITVTLRSASGTLSTGNQVIQAIESSASASLLVTVESASGNDGSGNVTAMTIQYLAGPDRDLTFTAVNAGSAGNDISIEYVDPAGVTATESVAVTDEAIEVTLRHDGTSVTSTAAQVLAALEGSAPAMALITAALATGNDGTGTVTALAETNLAGGVDASVTLELQDLTGRTATSATVAASGTAIVTLDANDAGEAPLVGVLDNGPVLAVHPSDEYALVLKKSGIQLMTAVGQANGTFSVTPLIDNSGPIGRHAWCSMGRGRIVYVGKEDIFLYRVGAEPAPIFDHASKTFYDELDRSQLDRITLFHNEVLNEIWVLYPTTLGQRIMLWNYDEDSTTIDNYDGSLLGLSGAAAITWVTDPSWLSLPDTQTWDDVLDTLTWDQLIGGGDEENTVLSAETGELVVHGQVWSRNGEGYLAKAETMDYDYGYPDRIKYFDALHVGVRPADGSGQVTGNLYVQVGHRNSLDEEITWTAAKAISIDALGRRPSRLNFRGAGRFLRLRFYSEDADVRWVVTQWVMYARIGGYR